MLKLNRIAKQRFRRAADAEEGLRHVPFLGRIALPDQGPGRNIQANQLALGAEGVAVCGQKRRAARAVVIPEWINKTRVDRKSTRLNSSHLGISYAVFFLKK